MSQYCSGATTLVEVAGMTMKWFIARRCLGHAHRKSMLDIKEPLRYKRVFVSLPSFYDVQGIFFSPFRRLSEFLCSAGAPSHIFF